MRTTFVCVLCALCVLCGESVLAQPYRCDWAVVGAGGGEMSGTAYRCGATAGQTATGQLTGTTYAALIGFWQPDFTVGIREAAAPVPAVLRTELKAAQPSVFRSRTALRFTLDAERPVSLQVHDLTGRVVRTVCASSLKRGAYSFTWNATDAQGRSLSEGVYLVRLVAGDYSATGKLTLLR
ncbi:MAG: FlgD immunoglobulin-like domain containing protein [bacterium]